VLCTLFDILILLDKFYCDVCAMFDFARYKDATQCHCHSYSYSTSLEILNLKSTQNGEDV
jgi:hypothetical protein